MVFRSFGVFVCAHDVSLNVADPLPHLHLIYLADMAETQQ